MELNARTDPGLIGIIAQETARFSMFSASLSTLEVPAGSSVKWVFGHNMAESTNVLLREMYKRDLNWVWLLGDDHSFSPDLLTKLLAHEKDLIVPLCLLRNPPYKPVIFSGFEDEEAKTYIRRRVDLDDHPAGGLIEVHSAGSGGMLIRRQVLDAIPDPWFEAGVLDPQQFTEDVYFCDKAREAGFTIYCDLNANFGHCLTSVVWPVRGADGWTYGFSMMGGFQIIMPRSK